ncbi:hypothetical protein ANN_09208 [Periplaneta americana]|uniref:MADF domain-containing protein n=1 Tax=Periplaneta americana TaxID=6978 RepID=A0ABQ8TKR0_PERAM|nr:hypothetical protein ANN_09208 [Periplaneta americana]
MSDTEEDVGKKGEDLSLFMDIIKKFPVIFKKSMLPESRQKKSAAFANIREKYEKGFGVPITEAQLIKKVSNMKTRFKKDGKQAHKDERLSGFVWDL